MIDLPANRKWFELVGGAPSFLAELSEASDEVLSLLASELLLGVQSRMRRFLARSEGEAFGLFCY